eukprot:COSAG02_NODE_30619_length_548_cov_0.657016_1_plen_118_part_01
MPQPLCAVSTSIAISYLLSLVTVICNAVSDTDWLTDAYANFPQCALYNKYNLPASPFVAELGTRASSKAAVEPVQATSSAPAGVCKTPPMGVNSWNAFHCNVDERKMRAMADAVVSTG